MALAAFAMTRSPGFNDHLYILDPSRLHFAGRHEKTEVSCSSFIQGNDPSDERECLTLTLEDGCAFLEADKITRLH